MYLVKLKPKAIKDLQCIFKPEAGKIAERMKNLEQGLVGDIKRLTNFTPEYRLRIGDYRILFEIEGQEIIIHIGLNIEKKPIRRGKKYEITSTAN